MIVPQVIGCKLPFGDTAQQPTNVLFLIIFHPKLSRIQTRWTWCECKACQRTPWKAINASQKWPQRLGSYLKWWGTNYVLGSPLSNPQIFYFWSSFTQNWVRCRPDGRDVSTRHVTGHLEGPPMPVRSDRNDWDRLPKHGVKTTMFWKHHSTTHKFSIFDHLSPKTESDADQIDVMWAEGTSEDT